jgi:hypothetical protein
VNSAEPGRGRVQSTGIAFFGGALAPQRRASGQAYAPYHLGRAESRAINVGLLLHCHIINTLQRTKKEDETAISSLTNAERNLKDP